MSDAGANIVNIKEYRTLKKKERIEKEWPRVNRVLSDLREDELFHRLEKIEEAVRHLQGFLLSHDLELDEVEKKINLLFKAVAKLSLDSK
jgi:hypothetical protein